MKQNVYIPHKDRDMNNNGEKISNNNNNINNIRAYIKTSKADNRKIKNDMNKNIDKNNNKNEENEI